MSRVKLLIRNILFVILGAVILYVGASIFVLTFGKKILNDRLSSLSGGKFEVRAMEFVFPWAVQIEDVFVDGRRLAKSTHARLNLWALFSREIVVPELFLVEPDLRLERTQEGKIVWGGAASAAGENNADSGGSDVSSVGGNKGFLTQVSPKAPDGVPPSRDGNRFVVNHLVIENGRLGFVDHLAGRENRFFPLDKLEFEDVDLVVRHLAFPGQTANTEFDFTGLFTLADSNFSGQKFESRGWINLARKDMDGELKILKPDGKVTLLADLRSQDNDMQVEGEIHISRIFEQEEKPEDAEDPESKAGQFLLQGLSSAGFDLGAKFSFKTKMDKFQVRNLSFSGSVMTGNGEAVPSPDAAVAAPDSVGTGSGGN